MKDKVLKDFPTADGVLYKEEIVKQWDAFKTSKNLRVKDTMGRIWNVPKKLLQRIGNE